MTKSQKILILAIYIGLVLIFLFCLKFPVQCLFKKFFHIFCPGCGLTRAFISILNFKFLESFKYNILAMPLFGFLIIVFILNLYDLLFNKNYLVIFVNKIAQNSFLILIMIFISFVINNYRGI